MKRPLVACAVALFLWLLAGVSAGRAEPVQLSEGQVKAAYLYNFAKFSEWPATAFVSAGAPLVVCILGANPFGDAVTALFGNTVHNRRTQLRQISRAEDAEGCHLLFIGDSEGRRLKQTLSKVSSQGVLTVGDSKDFVRNGGVIGLVMQGERIRFEISLANAERAGVRISSQLMKLATNVR